jgi:hypothetical protein
MNTIRVRQSDDPPRAISVQNPMSINDLMINQQNRRLSTGAVRRGGPPRPVQLPPQAQASQPRRSSQDVPEMEPDPEEMGYGMILNQQKAKKNDPEEQSNQQRFDEDDMPDEPDHRDDFSSAPPADDYVDPRERREYERGTMGDRAPDYRPLDLPPQSASPHATPPRRLSIPSAHSQSTFQPPSASPMQSPMRGGLQPPSAPSVGMRKPYMSYEEQSEKKCKYLEGLDKFRRRGMKVAPLDINSPFEEVETEYNRHKRSVDVEASIQFSRKMLMAVVTGLEYINSRWDPMGLQLDGWSESVIEDIHNYDDVFEKLYDKYHTSFEMAPEFELMLMVAGSAFMFHLTNSMFKSTMPGMGNPDMMRNVRRGVMGAMRGAFNGASNGGGVASMMSGMFGGGGGSGSEDAKRSKPSSSSSSQGPPPPVSGRSAPVSSTGRRREMRGPNANMDDLLNNLMDREPGEVSERLVEEIDDILNNPSDDDRDATRTVQARAGPGGSVALNQNPPVVDI